MGHGSPSFADVHRHLHALLRVVLAVLAMAQGAGVVATAPRATEVGALPGFLGKSPGFMGKP